MIRHAIATFSLLTAFLLVPTTAADAPARAVLYEEAWTDEHVAGQVHLLFGVAVDQVYTDIRVEWGCRGYSTHLAVTGSKALAPDDPVGPAVLQSSCDGTFGHGSGQIGGGPWGPAETWAPGVYVAHLTLHRTGYWHLPSPLISPELLEMAPESTPGGWVRITGVAAS